MTESSSSSRSDPHIRELAAQVTSYASCHGIVMLDSSSSAEHNNDGQGQKKQNQKQQPSSSRYVPIPSTLRPSEGVVSRAWFTELAGLVPALCRLVDRMVRGSMEHEHEQQQQRGEAEAVSGLSWMVRALGPAAAVDKAFTGRLLALCREKHREGCTDGEIMMGIHRADWMVDGQSGVPQMVEVNTIASSFAAISTHVAQMHRMLAMSQEGETHVLQSDSLASVVRCLLTGDAAYRETHALPDHTHTVVAMVVQRDERNVCDQGMLEWELRRQAPSGREVIMKRVALGDICAEMSPVSQGPASGGLQWGDRMVSVVYYRAGYGPSDYPTEQGWEDRRLVELSNVVKCPSVEYQLAGCKKIQQLLSERDVLLKLGMQEKEADALLRVCTDMASCDDDDLLRRIVDQESDDWVMKPQREGGGNLLYGDKMVQMIQHMLSSGNKSNRDQYVLMRRIRPRTQHTYILREGVVSEGEVVSELGIFGLYVGNGAGRVWMNETGGYLLRTKMEKSMDGGVASGVACMDSLAFREE